VVGEDVLRITLAGKAIQAKRVMRSAKFWLILLVLAALSIVHYAEQLGIIGTVSPSYHFGLGRHAVERVLFLVPIIYAGFTFRLRIGLITCFIALLIMLPRALFISPSPIDALVESAGVFLTGTLACFWFEAQLKAKEQRQQATIELEEVQQELQSYVRLSRSNEKRLATLNAISNMLSRSFELEEVLHSALNMVAEVMETEVVLIYFLDEEAQELRLMAYEGVSDKFARGIDRMKLGEGLNGQVAMTGQPLIVGNASHDSRLTRQIVREEKIEAVLIVPLKATGYIIGTLCVANRRPRQFLTEEIELLTTIGGQVGITMENARFYREQQRTAQQYQDIFRNASDAIWVQDLEGNILRANRATAKLTGYSTEELTHMNVASFLREQELNLAKEVRGKLLQGEPMDEPYEQRLIKRDGTEAFLKLTSSLVISDGQPVGLQHVARDVTEERRMQENLRFYLQQVTRAQEEERKRIARELHDETTQSLVAIAHQMENLAFNNKHLSAEDIELLNNLREQVKNALQGVRQFSQDLRLPVLDDLGLLPALEWLTSNLEKEYKIKTELKVIGTQRRLGSEAEILLFRIVQEAVNNAGRHAEASQVEVTVEFSEDKIMTTIRDDGKGFELPRTLGELARIGKLGLAGMEERARLLGGNLTVQTLPGKGTTVVVNAPV
jgi:PAS domain S-box-containing protein